MSCLVPNLGPDEALNLVLQQTPVLGVERVSLESSCSRVLAENVYTDRDYPPFNRAMMDGVGILLSDSGSGVRSIGEITPGQPARQIILPGEAVYLMTGASTPPSVEAIVPIEQIREDNGVIQLPEVVRPGQHIALQGSESTLGQHLFSPGTRITPLVLASLATVGISNPLVYSLPSVSVITTGDELVPESSSPDNTHIRDSNRPLLIALLQNLLIAPTHILHAQDQPDAVIEALRTSDCSDVILCTGGVSAGNHDYVTHAAETEGWETVFHKVSQQPGKPLLFCTRGNQLLFGLPGNPLAVHLCFHRYVAPALRKMVGPTSEQQRQNGTLSTQLANKGPRTQFVLMHAHFRQGNWHLTPAPCKGSADVLNPATANSLVRVEPNQLLPENTSVPFEWLLGFNHP